MSRFIVLSLAAALGFAGLGSADEQKLVFFGDSRPVVIGLTIESAGKPLQRAWDECVAKVFRHLDADADGNLNEAEVARMPQPGVLFGGNTGFSRRAFLNPAPVPNVDADKNGKVTQDELKEFLLHNGGAPFRVEFGASQQFGGRIVFFNGAAQGGPATSADAVNSAVFNYLDTDKDGRLSQAEFAASPEVLKKLDTNDDEMISLNELGVNAGQAGIRTIAVDEAAAAVVRLVDQPSAVTGPFALATDKTLGQQLLKRYGARDATTLSRKQVGLGVELFQKLDANEDDTLDATELAAVGGLPADVRVKVSLGDKPAVEVIGEARTDKDAVKVTAKDSLVILELGVSRVELSLGGGEQNGNLRFAQDVELMQFKTADTDNNGYLDEKEAMGNPLFRTAFKQMDRDADGMLFEKEVKAFMEAIKDLQSAAKAGTAVLNITDQGRGVFDLIDTRRDGQLGVRELRQASAILARLDRDGDGLLDRAEIPRSYQLRANQGGGSGNGTVFAVAAFGDRMPAPPVPQPTEGPTWFRKMDRNRDGDVSLREFLGGEGEFKRIDADHDGLISSAEASKAESKQSK